MYPKNAWYVACTPDEIAEKPLGRTICGEKIVFYRPAPDQVAALDDFCPHRGAPLSLGTVCEGHLQCGYHGLRVECTGKSVSMPGQRVQGFPKARSFPVVERYGFIWVWPGDADKADPATIHHLPWADNPEWAYGGGLYHIACDYRLMIDNLMDLTHETYVHSTSIGQKEIDEVPCKTRVEGDEVITSRFMEGIQPPPFWQMALRMNGLPDDQPVDRWQICHFTPPSHVLIEVGVALAGHGGYNAPADKKASSIVVDFITPETETSIHYFWGMARNFKPQDPSLTTQIREGQGKIFAEDQDMLEMQQQNLLRYPDRKLLMLNIDAGGVQSRKVLDRILAAEQAPAPQPGGGRMTAQETLQVRVVQKRTEAEGIASFELARVDGAALPPFSAGSHIDVHLPGGLTRQYSLCNASHESHRYRIAVLRDAASRGGSVAMHDSVHEGDVITISTPRNHFALHPAQRTVLLAGGIGVTPLLCMADRLARTGADFALHYCTRSVERTAFASEIAASAMGPHVHFHFDAGAPEQKLDLAAVLAAPGADKRLYVCGPAGFIDHVVGTAKAMGWAPDNIHLEYFGAPAQDTSGDQGFEVRIASTGKVYPIAADVSVVEALRKEGIDILTSCEQGVCGTCLTRVLEGEVDHRDMYLTDEEKAANEQFMPCCSRARSKLLVLDL